MNLEGMCMSLIRRGKMTSSVFPAQSWALMDTEGVVVLPSHSVHQAL